MSTSLDDAGASNSSPLPGADGPDDEVWRSRVPPPVATRFRHAAGRTWLALAGAVLALAACSGNGGEQRPTSRGCPRARRAPRQGARPSPTSSTRAISAEPPSRPTSSRTPSSRRSPRNIPDPLGGADGGGEEAAERRQLSASRASAAEEVGCRSSRDEAIPRGPEGRGRGDEAKELDQQIKARPAAQGVRQGQRQGERGDGEGDE